MDLNMIFDVFCLHGEDAALHAAEAIVKEFLHSKTQNQICDRRDEIAQECLKRKINNKEGE